VRRVVLVLVLVVVLAMAAQPHLATASAQPETTTSTSTLPSSEGGIIPKPNTGVAPQDSGDRGGAAQTALFFVMLGGVGLIGFLAYRSSVKARRSAS